jgi:hypothetical protein
LCAVGLLTLGAPWGAYRVSERSQVDRLTGLLTRNSLLAEGQVRAASGGVSQADRRQIGAALEYLGKTHGYRAIARWFPDSVRARGGALGDLRPRRDPWHAVERIMAVLHLEPAREPPAGGWFRYAARSGQAPVAVTGFDLLLSVNDWSTTAVPDSGWTVRGDTARVELVVWRDGKQVAAFALGDLLASLRQEGAEQHAVAPERLRADRPGPGVFLIRRLTGRWVDDRAVVQELSGVVLLPAVDAR